MKTMRKTHFTLVEILVVLAVAAMLIAIGLPAFNRLIQGNALQRTGSRVQIMLRQAQSNAVSARRHTALLIDIEDKAENGTPSMRLCYLKQLTSGDSTSSAEFDGFIPGGKWVPMRDGAAIVYAALADSATDPEEFAVSDQNALPANGAAPDVSRLQKVTKVQNDGGNEINARFPAIFFTRYGALHNQIRPARILIAEGMIENNALIYTGERDTNNRPRSAMKISLNPFSGKPSTAYRSN